jgi:hypothetical protein
MAVEAGNRERHAKGIPDADGVLRGLDVGRAARRSAGFSVLHQGMRLRRLAWGL